MHSHLAGWDRLHQIRGMRVGLLLHWTFTGWVVLAVSGAIGSAFGQTANGGAEELSGREIIDRHLAAMEVDSEIAFIVMEVTASGQKVKENRFLTLFRKTGPASREYFVRLIRPKEVEGVTVLTHEPNGKESEQFVFLPAVGKMQKLTEPSRKGSFLGSDFTYEDLMLEAPAAYQYERQADRKPTGVDCYVVRATPTDEGPDSAYAYRDLYLTKDDFHLVKIDFYDQQNRFMKMMTAYDYESDKIKGQSKRPRTARMLDVKKGTATTFTVMESRLNEDFDPKLFTPAKLENWPPDEIEELIFRFGITVTAE